MAKIMPDLAGSYRRSIGNVVYYLRDGENLARAKSKAPYTSNSSAQQEQKGKFGDLSHLGSTMQKVIKIAFPQRRRGLSAVNAFHRTNKDCFVKPTDGQPTIDFVGLKCAKGTLYPPFVSATLDAESKSIEFQCVAMPDETNCSKDDVVYAMLYDKKNDFCNLVKISNRGEGGKATVVLSNFWDAEATMVYAFAVSVDGRKASNSLYIGLS